MKKYLILIAILSLTGCNALKDDVTKSYENVTQKSGELKAQVIDTVNKIEETKKDIEEAKKAVDKVFE